MSTKRNKTSTPLALTVAAILGISGSAIAGDGRPEYSEGHQRIVYGKVIDVTPMYQQVRVTTPVKECWSEPVTRSHRVYDGGHTAGSTLAGANSQAAPIDASTMPIPGATRGTSPAGSKR